MVKRRAFWIVVATDGSTGGRAAVAAVLAGPWPAGTQVQGVVARGRGARAVPWSLPIGAALDRGLERVATDARRALGRRWPDAQVVVVDRPPVDGILVEAERVGARAIVLGWRGHGAVRRRLMGSVSRRVVRRARCSVLVVRRRPRALRRFVIGLDGSAHARRAVAFVAGLTPSRDGRVTLVRVVEPIGLPTQSLLPASIRATIRGQVATVNAERVAHARRELDRAAARLRRAGWRVQPLIRSGVPLDELLTVVKAVRADLLVVGARGVVGLERLLLGSVADGALNQSPRPVLIVR